MPSNFTLRAVNTAHRALLRVSFGRMGTEYFGMPALELTTLGRKSGRPRSVMLTAPIVDGTDYVIVASRAGDPTNPAWYHNLRDNPAVEVAFRNGPRKPMTARVLPSEERAPLWARIVADYPVYGDYQKRTTREIPLVRLTPRMNE
ncbi:nitroreductase/quinone reductase family protein [Nocardia flavorosea]|uniref:Nitroreductase family deazaflavin-dependent oxidoreductase n=1 Tax=Nocardia flavorosea TaxID=53429 RepID=A0A846Y6T6_9NOCA|nr:nitroreductase/quinone reductase family protein [Nocardia flavorosea]NKY55286.1 nitroreductase family deazaflavin-dependent oxidoreductase [Nocardia flavorosea]